MYIATIIKVFNIKLKSYCACAVSMATNQLSPEMGSSVPEVERLSLNDGELSEPVRGKQKSTTTGLDHPQWMVQGNN